MKKLVIFDLDGTLLDSSKGITHSMNFALKTLNLEEITEEDTRTHICYGTEAFAKFSCKDHGELVSQCHELFLDNYKETALQNTTLQEGVRELLISLENKGVHLGILTNKPQNITEIIVNSLLKDFIFDAVVGFSDGGSLKPDPSGVDRILSSLHTERADAILVGDGESDAKTAENAGIDFIGVLWGNRTKKELRETGAVYFAKNPRKLLNMILYQYGKKHISKICGEFKQFITKGNVLDMAVGVIVGAAFSAIVNSLVKDLINPAVSLVTGGISLNELRWVLRPAVVSTVEGVEKVIKPEVTLNYGAFIQAVLNFLLIALTVFAIVKTVLAIRKKLDYNENIRKQIQEKLDKDTPLNRKEKRWMIRQGKKDKAHLPRKTVKAPPVVEPPKAPPEPILTDRLLMEILEELKAKNTKDG